MAGERLAAVDNKFEELLTKARPTDDGRSYSPVIPESKSTDVMRIRVEEDVFKKGIRMAKSLNAGGSERLATLSLLLTWTPTLPFDQLAQLLHERPAKLERWVHGQEAIPRSKAMRLTQVAIILSNLRKVLDVDATQQWLAVAIPDLGGRTPAEVFKGGRLDVLLELTESYLDPSFG
jgi:hypothetical protein